MSPQSEDYFEIHQLLSQELRHTATTVWQFSIAIVTLQGTAVGLSAQKGFESGLGRSVLLVGFALAFCFSIMLYRQAKDRSGFVERIKQVEEELRADYPRIFFKIESPPRWFRSEVLAWILFCESGGGLIWFAYKMVSA